MKYITVDAMVIDVRSEQSHRFQRTSVFMNTLIDNKDFILSVSVDSRQFSGNVQTSATRQAAYHHTADDVERP